MKKGIFVLLKGFWLFIILSLFTSHAYAAFNFSTFFSDLTQMLSGGSPAQTPTSPAQTPTSTRTNIDSRIVVPLGKSSKPPASAQSPGVKVLKQTYTQQEMTNLKPCPTNPICPDINGVWPAGGVAETSSSAGTCPDVCSVTRQDQTETMPNGSVRIISSSPAVCPTGYSATAVFNAGKEIIYKPAKSEADAIFPVPSMAVYQQYISSGYDCTTRIPGSYALRSCGSYFAAPSGNTVITGYSGGATITGVGIYTRTYNGGCFYKIAPYCTYATSCSSLINDMLYLYDYAFYKCYPPAGLYYSANTVTISVVCSAVKPVWRSGN